MWDENLGGEKINLYRHYRIAKELYDRYPKLKGKFLVGLMDGYGNEIKIICDGGYQNDLHQKNAGLEEGIIYESMGAVIKENPRSLK